MKEGVEIERSIVHIGGISRAVKCNEVNAEANKNHARPVRGAAGQRYYERIKIKYVKRRPASRGMASDINAGASHFSCCSADSRKSA